MSDNQNPEEKAVRDALMNLRQLLPDPTDTAQLPQLVEHLIKLSDNGLLAFDDNGGHITEKGRKWLEEMEKPEASTTPAAPATPPSAAISDAELLRRMFRVPTTEQVKKTAKRVFKMTPWHGLAPDKRVLRELRTYKYKANLAKKLEEDMKEPPPIDGRG